MKKQVLLIEDDDAMRASLAQTMDLEGITVVVANGLAQARRSIRANFSGVILSDIRMPHDDGFSVLEHVKSVDSELPVIMLTGEADVPMALRAIKQGAYDFLEKPCPSDALLEVLERALSFRNVVLKQRQLEREMKRNDPAAVNFPGASDASKTIRSDLRRLANAPAHICISGAEGTGRKLAAYTIHAMGAQGAQFIGYNFANNTEVLSDTFIPKGDVNFSIKSAQLASDDDISWLSQIVARQPCIRLLMSGTEGFSAGPAFRALRDVQDFSEISLPALRARRQDLPIIFEQVLRQLVRSLDLDMPIIPPETFAQIMTRDWQGNLVELRSFARSHLENMKLTNARAAPLTLAQQLENFEALVLRETLCQTQGKATQAASQLGLPRKTLYDRLSRYDIRPKDFK
jgi:two-component system C4-dicarboxylate transport response regulator DctD